MAGPSDRPLRIWSDVSQAILVANGLITVVAVGTHAAIMKVTGADELIQFAQVLGRTAPLALAVAVIVSFTLWQLGKDDFNLGFALLTSAAALFAATWVANRFGDLRVTEPLRNPQHAAWGLHAALEYALGMLLAYYRAYGVRDFWSSVIVGGALGWIWSAVIERTTERRDEDAADQQPRETERRAA